MKKFTNLPSISQLPAAQKLFVYQTYRTSRPFQCSHGNRLAADCSEVGVISMLPLDGFAANSSESTPSHRSHGTVHENTASLSTSLLIQTVPSDHNTTNACTGTSEGKAVLWIS